MNEGNLFSDIDDMKAELDAMNPRNSGNRRRRRVAVAADEGDMQSVPEEQNPSTSNHSDDIQGMLDEIDSVKQSSGFPTGVSFDLTVNQPGGARGDHTKKEKYKGLGFDSLYDVLMNKYG